jgi:hypothetical protein
VAVESARWKVSWRHGGVVTYWPKPQVGPAEPCHGGGGGGGGVTMLLG